MKNKALIRIICVILALVMTLPLIACGQKEKPFMSLEGEEMSAGVYNLLLSIQKGNMAYLINYYYGSHDSSEFWETVIEAPATNNNQYYTSAIFNKAKNLISAAVLFDQMKLTLSASTIKSIDDELNSLCQEFGGGNKEKFETILEEYGFNYDDLRSYKILNAKALAVANELYGSDGSKIGATLKQEYLEKHYSAFRQIFLANEYAVFKTDENGDVIYYDGNGNIAYDSEKGEPHIGSDGKFVYYTEDGKIAYDTKSGVPSPVLGEDGYQITAEYSYQELLERLDLAAELMEIGMESNEKFEALVSLYSDDSASASGSIYVANNVSYESFNSSLLFLDTVAEKLSEMKVGEVTLLQDESGLHIIRKYAIEEGAYAKKEYAGWFKDNTYGVYDFASNLKNDLFNAALADYHEKIEVDKDILSSASLRDIKPNYYYH